MEISQSDIQWYASHFSRYELLTTEQEHDLSTRLRAQERHLASMRERNDDSSADVQSYDLQLAEAESERRMLRDQFINANLRLAFAVAKEEWRRSGRSVPLDDMVQNANAGLIRAVDRFDPSLGFKFSTYAVWWIVAGIRRGRRQEAFVHVPEEQCARQDEIAAFSTLYRASHGHHPSEEEIVHGLGWSVPPERICGYVRDRRMRSGSSLDRPVDRDDPGDSARTIDFIAAAEITPKNAHEPELLENGITKLTSAQRQVIEMHYYDGFSFTEIADRLGVSVTMAANHHHRALGVLRLFATTYRGFSGEGIRNAIRPGWEQRSARESKVLECVYGLGMSVPAVAQHTGFEEHIVQRMLLRGVHYVRERKEDTTDRYALSNRLPVREYADRPLRDYQRDESALTERLAV